MKLWKIMDPAGAGYDGWRGAVVAAPTEEAARRIHPGGPAYTWTQERGWGDRWDGGWPAPHEVSVTYIGTAAAAVRAGVVLDSFHAG